MSEEIKVSGLTEASKVNEDDYVMIVQNGVNKKVKVSEIGTGDSEVDIIQEDETPSETNVYSAQAVQDILEQKSTYSTEEKIVGTWIDGKPLYRKVIYIDSLPNANFKNVAHNIQNLDTVASIVATGFSTSKTYYPIPLTGNSYMFGTSAQFAVRVDTSNVTIYAADDKTTHQAHVVIEYTKTIDQ